MSNGNGVIENQVREAVSKVAVFYHQHEWRRWAEAFLGQIALSDGTLLETARAVETKAAVEWALEARHGMHDRAQRALAGRKAARAVWAWRAALDNDRDLELARRRFDQDQIRMLVQRGIDLLAEAQVNAVEAIELVQ